MTKFAQKRQQVFGPSLKVCVRNISEQELKGSSNSYMWDTMQTISFDIGVKDDVLSDSTQYSKLRELGKVKMYALRSLKNYNP